MIKITISRSPAAKSSVSEDSCNWPVRDWPVRHDAPIRHGSSGKLKSAGEHSTADSGQPTSAPQTHCVQSAQPSRLWLLLIIILILLGPTDPLINTAAFSPVLPICATSAAVSTAYRPSRTHLPQFCNSQPTASTPLSRYLQITHKYQKT